MRVLAGYSKVLLNTNNIKDSLNKDSDNFNAKNQLARVLFGKSLPATGNISFGWSNYLTKEETEILDVLTNTKNKSFVVASHSYPDGDAYGSNIGISGILTSMGKSVKSIIDFRPKMAFQFLPSPDPNKTATKYIQPPKELNTLKNIDVAVFTDTAEPDLLKGNKNSKYNNVLKTIAEKKPHTVIIIDHHPDDENGKTNKDKWLIALKSAGIKANKILYWREKRASAAEMVSELDQEIVKESKQRSIKGYQPNFNHAYRLAVATGNYNRCRRHYHKKR